MKEAKDILNFCTDARRRRWRTDEQREDLENYYNSGRIPNYGCGREQMSLGLGNRHLRRPHKTLRSTIEFEPAPFDIHLKDSPDYNKKASNEIIFEEELGPFLRDHYRTLTTQVAGDFLITGRAFAWRASRWDAKFEFGRPLVEADADPNILSDGFWRWAFPMRLTMRQIDHYLKTARGENNNGGWQKEGLRALKKYILEKPRLEKGETYSVTQAQIDEPFPEDYNDPLNCYVYFEKQDAKNGVYRKIDMTIVSRVSENCVIDKVQEVDHRTRKRTIGKELTLSVKEPEKEKVIFRQSGAFDSVRECLISWVEDARISGAQTIDDIQGDGIQFFPRLQVMEEMLDSATAGTAFAMQPNWVQNGDVPKRVLQRLQETGLPKWAVAPPIQMLDKSGVISSSNAGMGIVQSLGLSIEEESSVNNLPSSMGHRAQTEFKAEAEQLVNSRNEALTLRMTFWHAGWDNLFDQVCRTFTRPEKKWRPSDPSYHEVMEFQKNYKRRGGQISALRQDNVEFRSRRLPGGGDRATALSRFMVILNNPNAPAEQQQWAWNQLISLMFGPEAAKHFEGDGRDRDLSQEETALLQNNTALASGLGIPPQPGDDPLVHLQQFHFPALQQQLRISSNQQYRTARETAGVQALLEHISLDIANVPGTAQQQFILVGKQIAQAYFQIPEQTPVDEARMQEMEMQIKLAKTQNEVANGESLRSSRAQDQQRKAQGQEIDILNTAKKHAQMDQRIALEEERAREQATQLLAI